MGKIRLIHWNAAEAKERAERLRAAGHTVEHRPPTPADLKKLGDDPADAVVIDLGRIPSQGRDFALAIRERKSTRLIPIVFVEGDAEKLERIRELLPDAAFTTWIRIRGALRRAIAHPPTDPVVPDSRLGAYAGRPLCRKLGIKAGMTVALVNAPEGFERTLGKLPDDVTLRRQARGTCDLVVWFVRWRRNLERRVQQMSARAGKGGLWIAWPKKASGTPSDLTQAVVRKTGLAAGLVDYKVCAIDSTWSGLRFTRRAHA